MNCSFNLSLRHWLAEGQSRDCQDVRTPCRDESMLQARRWETFMIFFRIFRRIFHRPKSSRRLQQIQWDNVLCLPGPRHQDVQFHSFVRSPISPTCHSASLSHIHSHSKCSSTHKVGGTFFSSCALQQCFRISDLQLSPTPVCPGPLDLSWSWL